MRVVHALVRVSPPPHQLVEVCVVQVLVARHRDDAAWAGAVQEEVAVPLRRVPRAVDVREDGLHRAHAPVRVERVRHLELYDLFKLQRNSLAPGACVDPAGQVRVGVGHRGHAVRSDRPHLKRDGREPRVTRNHPVALPRQVQVLLERLYERLPRVEVTRVVQDVEREVVAHALPGGVRVVPGPALAK